MIKHTLSRFAGLVLLLAVQTSSAQATADTPQALVKDTTEKVLGVLSTEGDALTKDPQRLYQLINDLIVPHFDFRQMSQWVLGRAWRDADEAQKTDFAKQFELLLVRTYSDALVSYRDQSVEFLPTRERSDTEVTVRAKLQQSGGPSVPVTYEMHKVNGAWKVYDIAIEGVSLVINYRSSFADEIKRRGIDGLIKRLEAKNKTDNG